MSTVLLLCREEGILFQRSGIALLKVGEICCEVLLYTRWLHVCDVCRHA